MKLIVDYVVGLEILWSKGKRNSFKLLDFDAIFYFMYLFIRTMHIN